MPPTQIGGPISVKEYMRQVLVNPLSGYYMKGDVFGAEGDFVTSPEISQMFGEVSYWACEGVSWRVVSLVGPFV
jgi:NADH dehydrogenase [ubiquinone] 1 alpha subcomplex assembly factor 7